MTTDTPSRAIAFRVRALSDAARTAGQAPSIHNTQPWRWRLIGDELTLRVDHGNTSDPAAPDSRLAILSCGAALHHATVSLASAGWHALVARMPDPAHPDCLAQLRVGRRIPISLTARRHRQTIGIRHTDHRAGPGAPINAGTLDLVVAAAESAGARLRLLPPGEMHDLAAAGDRAGCCEIADTARPPGAGPGRNTTMFAVLHGAGDDEVDWLRAGEALSAAWLRATELGMSVLPLSAPVEVAAIRERIRRDLLAGSGHPYLVLRLNTGDPTATAAPRTPRLPTDRLIEHG